MELKQLMECSEEPVCEADHSLPDERYVTENYITRLTSVDGLEGASYTRSPYWVLCETLP